MCLHLAKPNLPISVVVCPMRFLNVYSVHNLHPPQLTASRSHVGRRVEWILRHCLSGELFFILNFICCDTRLTCQYARCSHCLLAALSLNLGYRLSMMRRRLVHYFQIIIFCGEFFQQDLSGCAHGVQLDCLSPIFLLCLWSTDTFYGQVDPRNSNAFLVNHIPQVVY